MRPGTGGDGRAGVWHGWAGSCQGGVARAGRDAGRCGRAGQGAVGGIGRGRGRVPGGGNWVGVKGELSLASPNPHRGFGLARDSLGRCFWRVGDEGWGREGTAGRHRGRWVRGRGAGVGWGRLERKRRVWDRPRRRVRKRRGRSVAKVARSRRRRVSMAAPGEGCGIRHL